MRPPAAMNDFADALAYNFVSIFLCGQQGCCIYLDNNPIRADHQDWIRDGIEELLPGFVMIYLLRLTAAGYIFVFIHSRGDGQIAGEISSVN